MNTIYQLPFGNGMAVQLPDDEFNTIENYLIQKIELFDRKSYHLKSQFFKGYKKYLNKFWRPNEIEMINHQNGKSTILFFEEMRFQTGLTEEDFTQNSLKRSK